MNLNTVVILPSYNEEEYIVRLIEEIKKYASEILVVANGCNDRTAEIAAKSGVIVLELSRKGKGNAVIRGIEFTKSLNPDMIILMDSDGQHNPKEILHLIKPLLEGYDMVIGSRFLGTIKTSNLNKFGNHLLNILHFLLTFKWITDTQSGFKSFRAEKLYSLKLTATNYAIESDILLEAIKNNLRIKEIPIGILKKEKGINTTDGFRIVNFIIKRYLKMF